MNVVVVYRTTLLASLNERQNFRTTIFEPFYTTYFRTIIFLIVKRGFIGPLTSTKGFDMSEEKLTRKERFVNFLVKVQIKLAACGAIGLALWWIIKFLVCTFGGICIM